MRLLAVSKPLSLSDVGRSLGLSPSSGLNLLKTLAAEGAIERDERTKLYRIASPWAASDALRDVTGQLVDRAQPLMNSLAHASEAAVGLWKTVSRDRMQLVAQAESDAGMRLRLADGQRQPLGGGAAGRAIAAAQAVDKTELARRFAPVRWQAELPFDIYTRQVREAVRTGFAVDRNFAHRGVCTVAAGIADLPPGFCVSASILDGSRTDAEIDALGAALGKLCDELRRKLAGR